METESIITRAERLAAEFEEKARIVNENADSLERESVTEYNVKNQLAQVSRGRSSAEDFRLAAQALRACIEASKRENWCEENLDYDYSRIFDAPGIESGRNGFEFFQRALTVKE